MLPRWSDTYLVGHPSMDTQHKELLDYAASLVSARTCEMQVLFANGLYDLALAHFAHEDEIMRSIHYVDFDEHRGQHQQLLSRLDEIRHEIAGRRLHLNNFDTEINEWLVTHIINFDAELSAQIKALEYWGCDVD
jgi:hemerythrin